GRSADGRGGADGEDLLQLTAQRSVLEPEGGRGPLRDHRPGRALRPAARPLRGRDCRAGRVGGLSHRTLELFVPGWAIGKVSRLAMSTSATAESPLELLSEPVRKWFQASFEAPTPAQAAGWPAIASGGHTLICAPTGSGKTLASFLWGIDRLARERERLGSGVRIVYVSPLKALSYDIERNLRAPLQGIGSPISVALRTGDTPQSERRAMRREPPDILITTPESLYLMIS